MTGRTKDGKWVRIAHGGADAFVSHTVVKPASEIVAAVPPENDASAGTTRTGRVFERVVGQRESARGREPLSD